MTNVLRSGSNDCRAHERLIDHGFPATIGLSLHDLGDVRKEPLSSGRKFLTMPLGERIDE